MRSHRLLSISLAALIWGLFLAGAGCTDTDAGATGNHSEIDSTYVLETYGTGYCSLIIVDELEGAMTTTTNGFPVDHFPMGRYTSDTICPRIETALIGSGNRLDARIAPYLSIRKGNLHLGTVNLQLHARRMGKGPALPPLSLAKRTSEEIRQTYRDWGNALLPVWREYLQRQEADREANPGAQPWALDSMRAYVRQNPLVISMRFTNRYGPDFSDLFEEAPVIEGTPADSTRLRRYALRLRDLMAAKDTAALYEAFLPMFQHSDRVREARGIRSASKLSPKERAFKHMIIDGVELDFGADDVVLQKWSDGRIWELRRGHEPLFSQKQGNGGFREVFISQLGDTLRVIR